MSSQIYKKILNRKIENFVEIFSNDSNKIFKKEDNTLIHPEEFGKYRERACKDILRIVLKKDVDISEGFIITSNNSISTQCDIIIYNTDTVKLISNDIARMFPIEEVRAIGEIKSNMSKKDFEIALRKLANNKKLEDERCNVILKRKYSDKTYDTVPTFLICNKFEFDYEKIKLEEIYKDIPRKYWHNAILSIEDGFISYVLDFNRGSENTIRILKENKFNIDALGIWSYPYKYFNDDIIETRENIVYVNSKEKYNHIINFFVNVASLVNDTYMYEHDFVEYLGLNTEKFFMND